MPVSRAVTDPSLVERWLEQAADFRCLSPGLAADLARGSTWRLLDYREPAQVYDFDEAPAGLYLVRRGEFHATRRQAPTGNPRLYTYRRGHVFGEEGVFPASGPADRVRVNAPGGGELALWSAASITAYRAALRGRSAADPALRPWCDELDRVLRGMYEIERNAPLLTDRLRLAHGAASLSESQLRVMLEGADYLRLEPDDPPIEIPPFGQPTGDASTGDAPTRDARGIYVLLRWEARVQAHGESTGGHVLNPESKPIFDTEMLADAMRLCVDVPTTLVRVPARRVEELLAHSTAFRRRILADTFPSTPIGQRARVIDPACMQAVAVTVDHTLELPFDGAALVGAVAASMARQFDDRVRVVHVCEVAPAGAPPEDWVDAVALASVESPEALWRHGGAAYHHDYVVLDLTRATADQRRWVAPAVDTWLRLTDTGSLADLADGRDDDQDDGLHPLAVEIPVFLVGLGRRDTGRLTLTHPLRSVRMAVTGVPEGERAPGLPVAQRAVDRLARAATDRLVGVALGGGGALGIAHLPLLRAIERAGVPIDIVSGASFGSVVAAYYCTDGLAGLDRLERNLARISRPSIGGFIPPNRVLDLLDERLERARLEELPVQFVPVATYASDFTPALPAASSVSSAVRASGAMPPIFAAHGDGGVRFLDGAFVANVPAQVLVACGASLVIASDPISTPDAQSAPVVGRRSGFALSLLRGSVPYRLVDLARGLQWMVHTSSADSSLKGDVLFRPPRATLVDTFRFGKGPQILAASAAAIESTDLVPRVLAAWRQLRGHPVSAPSVAEPSVSTPSVSEPSVSTPSVSEPSVSEPSVSTPGGASQARLTVSRQP